jgi:Lon protease-like protein
MALPLHIFEPRYREMTASCLADEAPFGIVLALPGGAHLAEKPAQVGTLARIVHHQKLADGRYNLLAVGTQRFEIAELRREKPYLTGLVRPLADGDTGDPAAAALVPEARCALREYLRVVMALIGGDDCPIDIPDDPGDLSFLVGMCLTDDDAKQDLLALDSVVERLRAGVRMLRAEADALVQGADSITRIQPDQDRAKLN